MPWPSAPRITLSAQQRGVVDRLVRASTTPQAVAVRARLVSAAAEGTSTRQLAHRLPVTRHTVQVWRGRLGAGAAALPAAPPPRGGGGHPGGGGGGPRGG